MGKDCDVVERCVDCDKCIHTEEIRCEECQIKHEEVTK